MRKRMSEWMELMCDKNYEPAWQRPLEWMLIGSCITLLLMGFAMGVI